MEIFQPIAGFPNYQISNQGRVLGPSGRVLAQSLHPVGYPTVSLYAGGKGHTKTVHRLVALSFIPGDHSLTVNHKDGCKVNNAEDNLEWMTNLENLRHSRNTGLHPAALTDAERAELFADYLVGGCTQQALADKYGIASSNIAMQLKALRPSRPSQPRRAVAEHGTPAMYGNHGCRCTLCRAANTESGRQYRKRKSASPMI